MLFSRLEIDHRVARRCSFPWRRGWGAEGLDGAGRAERGCRGRAAPAGLCCSRPSCLPSSHRASPVCGPAGSALAVTFPLAPDAGRELNGNSAGIGGRYRDLRSAGEADSSTQRPRKHERCVSSSHGSKSCPGRERKSPSKKVLSLSPRQGLCPQPAPGPEVRLRRQPRGPQESGGQQRSSPPPPRAALLSSGWLLQLFMHPGADSVCALGWRHRLSNLRRLGSASLLPSLSAPGAGREPLGKQLALPGRRILSPSSHRLQV